MSRGPNLLRAVSWEAEATLFQEICTAALEELRLDSTVERNEDSLNRTMVRMFNRVVYRFEQAGRVIGGQVVPEALNYPDLSRARQPREKKRPDFRYQFRDTQVDDPDLCTREVVAECKRVARPQKGRRFTQLYVDEGVKRFDDPEHAYALGCASGLMLGYVQDMAHATVLREIQSGLNKHMLGIMKPPSNGWRLGGVSELDHRFTRQIHPTRFRLVHLWVDLRDTAKAGSNCGVRALPLIPIVFS